MINALDIGTWMRRKTVTVLAPGPNGKPYWDKLRGLRIVVNKGVEIPTETDFWLVTDWWALKTEWFYKHHDSYPGARIYSEGLVTKLPEYIEDPKMPHWFVKLVDGRDCVKPLGTGMYENVPGRLRPDGTVAGSAVELALKCGAAEIVLCGVDMEGDKYYDGDECISTTCDHQGEWAYTPYFNSLIRLAKEQGVDIWSMSKTTLDIEVRDG